MAIDWVVIVNKVPEVALILVFVWFTLKMLREFRDYLIDQNERWRKQAEKRDEAYLGKLSEVGDKQSNGVETLSKDIRSQTKIMTKMCEQMETHDELLEFIADDVKARRIRAD